MRGSEGVISFGCGKGGVVGLMWSVGVLGIVFRKRGRGTTIYTPSIVHPRKTRFDSSRRWEFYRLL